MLGLEAAKALLDLGIENPDVIEFAPRLMPRQLDEAGAEMLASTLTSIGLNIHTNKNTAKITGEGCIAGMQFTDGTSLQTDILVVSAGIKPRGWLLNVV